MPADGTFQNPWPHRGHGVLDILRWKCGLPPFDAPRVPNAPDTAAPRITLDPQDIARPPASGWKTTWLGHSSFLLQGCGLSILIDPVFSSHCAPLPLPALRRVVATPCSIGELPAIDVVLLTHSHYDHLDLSTLRALGHHTHLMVPQGHRHWLKRKGFSNITEVPWFGSVRVTDKVSITSTPAQHFTARTPWDRDKAHWCGWLVDDGSHRIWHAGDSGYCPAFREIGERMGPIDLGMIPIGAYQPAHIMRAMHLDPHDAARVFLETRCRRAVAMHWGTFRLTDEPLGEPPLLLQQALSEQNIPADHFTAGAVGQSWRVE